MAVAKGPERDAGRETLFMPDREAIKLEPRDPVLYFIQRLRDEAHRFVIGSHRKLRKKDIREAGLPEVPRIGPARQAPFAAPLRNAQGDRAGLDRRPRQGSRRQRRERPQDFRVFPRPAGLNQRLFIRTSPATGHLGHDAESMSQGYEKLMLKQGAKA